MAKILAATGQAALDHHFRAAKLTTPSDSLAQVDCGPGKFSIPIRRPLSSGGKTVAELPAELFAYAGSVTPGGGALNTIVQARDIDAGVELRYLDAGEPAAPVSALLDELKIETRFLGLRPVPQNAVFGCRAAGDKQILKSPLASPNRLPSDFDDKITWLLQAQAVCANSVKDRMVMTRIASAAAREKVRLYSVMTPSLAPDYLMEAVLPWSTAVISGADEAGVSLGVRFADAMEAVGAIRGLSQTAFVFVTLGKNGGLVADPSEQAVFHVRLRTAVLDDVQHWLAADPSSTCGCGDSFAAGAMVYLETGLSLLHGHLHEAPGVAAALSGSATAVARLLYPGAIAPVDFEIHEYPPIPRPYQEARFRHGA